MTGRTLLILGAGADQMPAYRAAQRLGCTIIGVDRNPDAPAATLADRFFPVSVRDPLGIVAALGGARPDGVVTVGSDLPLPALRALTAHYGLPGSLSPEAVDASTDKGFFRQVLASLPGRACRFVHGSDPAELRRAAADLRFPLVVKPVDAGGSKGVEAVADQGGLPAAITRALACSHTGRVIVEELITGLHLSCECFVVDGEPMLVVPTERGHTGPPRFLTTSHLIPVRLGPATTAALMELVRSICAAVRYGTGPLDLDLVLDRCGRLHPLEMGARAGGNGLAALLRVALGVDMAELSVRAALGERVVPAAAWRRVAMSCVLWSDRAGVLAGVSGREAVLAAPTTASLEVFAESGKPVAAFTSNAAKLGVLVLTGASHRQVTEAAAAARRTLRFLVTQPAAAPARQPAIGGVHP